MTTPTNSVEIRWPPQSDTLEKSVKRLAGSKLSIAQHVYSGAVEDIILILDTLRDTQQELDRQVRLMNQTAQFSTSCIKDLQQRLAKAEERVTICETSLAEANGSLSISEFMCKSLNDLIIKQHQMLRAFRHSMDTNKPFPSQEKLDAIIQEAIDILPPKESNE